MRPRLTAAQRRVIMSTGHLLVDAGAGSGKTTTVVRAICHQLGVTLPPVEGEEPLPGVSHVLTLDQVAAITFTNAAAADLKRKLRQSLRAGGRAEMAEDVDAARIGTIHGFCGDLLREHALRGRLRPVQRMLSDGEARVLVADCAREALHAAIERADVRGLPALLDGRRLRDVSEWVISAASDAGRLERWSATRAQLREHELALLELAQRATALRIARLDGEGLTDFDHILGSTRDLLRDDAVRHAVQRRIRLLVIDEFQDVDPVQREIADLMGGLARDDRDPARLLLVGDPKQSIYRFRRADVTLWKDLDARFRDGAGDVLPLSENFRSKAAILGFVDAVVGGLMSAPVDEARGAQTFEVAYLPLTPGAAGHDGDHAVELQVVPAAADGKTVTAGVAREFDAAGTAQRIAELKADGCAYGDIAVLLASWGDVETYEGALRAAGIPVYVRRGAGFWESREVLDCVLALRAVRDASDHVAMVGFLKSPFVGVRDETLLALARVRGQGSYASAIETLLSGEVTTATPAASDDDAYALRRAQALLTHFAGLRDRLTLPELLHRLLLDTGFIAESALERDGAQRCANLRKLLRLAGETPGRSLGEFLREVREARARGELVPPEPLYREHGDVVTITSVHGAKGLEWPVVFWCDLVREVRLESSPFCEGRDTFAIAPPVDALGPADGETADRHKELQVLCCQEALAEAYRLWYVAATRAKRLLVLSGIPLGVASRQSPTPARKFIERLGEMPGDGDLEYTASSGETFHARIRRLGATATSVAAPGTAPLELALAPSPVRVAEGPLRLSATQLMAFAHDAAGWRRTYVDRVPSASTGAVATRAVVMGQIVHDVLERIGDDTLDVMALIEAAISEWDEDAPGAESEAGALLRAMLHDRIEAAVGSSAWRAVAAAPGARRELWFTRLLADGAVLTGALDLVAPPAGSDGARILDVKTGASNAAVAAERYAVQAAVYVDAVRSIAGVDATFSLLSLPSGEVTTVPIPDAAAVQALVARLRRGKPTLPPTSA